MWATQNDHTTVAVQLTHNWVEEVVELVQVSAAFKARSVEYQSVELFSHAFLGFNTNSTNACFVGSGQDVSSSLCSRWEVNSRFRFFQVAHQIVQQSTALAGTNQNLTFEVSFLIWVVALQFDWGRQANVFQQAAAQVVVQHCFVKVAHGPFRSFLTCVWVTGVDTWITSARCTAPEGNRLDQH